MPCSGICFKLQNIQAFHGGISGRGGWTPSPLARQTASALCLWGQWLSPPPRHGQSEAQVGSARVGVTPLPTLAVLPGTLPDGVSLIDSSISGQRINCI